MAMPLGHGSAEQRLRPLTRRERRLAGGVAVTATIVAVVLVVITVLAPTRRSGHGCISVSLAYSTGGTQTYRCGAPARAMCDGASELSGAAGRDLARACRRAGLGVG